MDMGRLHFRQRDALGRVLPGPPAPVEPRFWAKVEKTPSCWLWAASIDRKGYGQLMVEGRPLRAHRISWEIHFGEIPEGAWVLHACDVRHCVNPEHLFLGDVIANNADMRTKGRASAPPRVSRRGRLQPTTRGELNPHAKLTEDAVRRIRALRAEGATYDAIASEVGISRSVAFSVASRKTWKHVE